SPQPSPQPSPAPSPRPSPQPSPQPSPVPSASPTSQPSPHPTPVPSALDIGILIAQVNQAASGCIPFRTVPADPQAGDFITFVRRGSVCPAEGSPADAVLFKNGFCANTVCPY